MGGGVMRPDGWAPLEEYRVHQMLASLLQRLTATLSSAVESGPTVEGRPLGVIFGDPGHASVEVKVQEPFWKQHVLRSEGTLITLTRAARPKRAAHSRSVY